MEALFAALAQVEGPVLLWFQALRNGLTDPLVAFYTHLGDHGLVWIGLCALLLCLPRTRRAGLAGAFALVCSLLLTNVLIKPLMARPRPWLVVEGLWALVFEGDPNSFPSGHTSAAFAAALAWWHTLPRKWGWVGLGAAGLMGLSRLYVGVHFPTDVLCGALVGTLCGYLGWRLLLFLEEKQHGME